MAERLRDRDSVHFIIELLKSRSGKVCHYQRDDVADDSCKESPIDIVGSKVYDSADKCKVPVVPKVDIDGCFSQQH